MMVVSAKSVIVPIMVEVITVGVVVVFSFVSMMVTVEESRFSVVVTVSLAGVLVAV